MLPIAPSSTRSDTNLGFLQTIRNGIDLLGQSIEPGREDGIGLVLGGSSPSRRLAAAQFSDFVGHHQPDHDQQTGIADLSDGAEQFGGPTVDFGRQGADVFLLAFVAADFIGAADHHDVDCRNHGSILKYGLETVDHRIETGFDDTCRLIEALIILGAGRQIGMAEQIASRPPQGSLEALHRLFESVDRRVALRK